MISCNAPKTRLPSLALLRRPLSSSVLLLVFSHRTFDRSLSQTIKARIFSYPRHLWIQLHSFSKCCVLCIAPRHIQMGSMASSSVSIALERHGSRHADAHSPFIGMACTHSVFVLAAF